MSVINKMLRDLDRRAQPSTAAQPGAASLRQGTASVTIDTLAPAQPMGAAGARVWTGLGLLAVAAAAVGGWWWWESAATAPKVPGAISTVAPVVMTPPAVAASAATTAAPAAASAAASAPLSVASTSTDGGAEASLASVFLRMEPSLSARKALDVLLSTPVPVAPSAPPSSAPTASPNVVTPAPIAAAATPQERPALRPQGAKATTPTSPSSPGATADSTPVLQRQQLAGGDALAQAQALWNSGSRDAAIDLMQQSIAAAERSAKAGGPSTSSTAVLLPLVREMARMQLAEARFGAVWEMLTRLEPLLGNPPDLWAIRANAAQRLGRHQDSVHAYMMALQSRPDEQRWLLGTAVSLAALGQTSSAADMAEKARALGPVGKDILAYLRQAGVPLREQ